MIGTDAKLFFLKMKQINFTVLILLLGCVGCERTRYASQFSEEAFERIKTGDTFSNVVNEIGKPIATYAYPSPQSGIKALPGGRIYEEVNWAKVPSVMTNLDRLLVLHYSSQVDARTDYKTCTVRIYNGRVIDKHWHLIKE